jgi:SAM-dependent methyltransferase
MTSEIGEDRRRWDTLAFEKGPLRAAWDEDHDGVGRCLDRLLPLLPDEGTVLDLGCGPGRLAVPVARARPGLLVIGLDVSPWMVAGAAYQANVAYLVGGPPAMRALCGLDGGWSVLLVQHVAEETVRSYLRVLAGLLAPGARFVVQFCEGAGDRFKVTGEDLGDMAAASGLAPFSCEVEPDGVWGWLVLEAP